jgi:hypothetical protein
MKVRDRGKKTGSNGAMCGGVAAVVVVVGEYVKLSRATIYFYFTPFESFIFLLFSLHSLSWYIAKDNK